MSIKDFFDKRVQKHKKLSTSLEDVSEFVEVESQANVGLTQAEQGEFQPPLHLRFSGASYAKYGSAEKYFIDSFNRVLREYPYDGSRAEIKSKFDQIVDFSGIEKFLDTPVKRYSSGMVIRLGFSVAAHLDPDILITDEVLAVADLDFREKSIKKLMQISDSGKTIIFVSHNLNSVRRLCKTAILLDKGRLLLKDNVDNVMSEYISLNKKRLPLLNNIKKDQDISPIEVIDSKIIGSKRSTKDVFPVNEKIGINFVFKVNDLSSDTYIKIQLFSSSQVHVLDSLDTKGLVFNQIGTCQRTVWINKNTLNEDNYYVCLHLISSPFENLKTHLIIDNIISFETAFYQNKNSVKGNFKDKWGGVVAPKLIWTD